MKTTYIRNPLVPQCVLMAQKVEINGPFYSSYLLVRELNVKASNSMSSGYEKSCLVTAQAKGNRTEATFCGC